MAPKIFLTGATGYIGGTALASIAKAHPDYDITLLVRSEERAKPVKEQYPNVKFAYGTLDDADVVEKAAAEADIVIHTADSSDNVPGAKAIAKGLATGHSKDNPGFWIHTSGTNILTWYDNEHKRSGEAPLPEQKYHDVDSIDKIVNLPDYADHRNVDQLVQGAISDAVRVAIICPPTIYGEGSGPVNTRSIQVPDMIKGTLQKGFAPIVSPGKTEWDDIHVSDLGDLFLLLAEATQDASKRDNPEIFGIKGYYFAENGSHAWADVAQWVAEEASKQGYLPEPLTKMVSQKEVDLMEGVSTTSYGQNSKGEAQRARKYLGWTPKGISLKDDIARMVASDAKVLGMTPKEQKP